MTRASAAANSLMLAVYQVCMMQHVPAFRLQSRTFTVIGAGGRQRPMFVGEWTDDLGETHRGGMTDWLLMPRIRTNLKGELYPKVATPNMTLTVVTSQTGIVVPLFVECKMGKNAKLEKEQRAFKAYVENAGAFYLELHDDVNVLLTWFDEHGVEKP